MTSLPQGFLDEISKYPQLSVLRTGLLDEPEISIRLNRAKLPEVSIDATIERVPWCPDGIYLDHRPQFTFDPSLHQGLYYVQDASSMAIYAAIKALCSDRPLKYLDACAAPGGKTTTALAALPAGSVVVANEYDYRRAEILAENISKWGNPNVVVTRGDTSRFKKLSHYFDIVAVDAPCSGEGMMRKDVQAVEQWSPSLVKQCAELQREILSNVWEALRPGGFLIYSTCTFNRSENEDNLHWLIEQYDAEPIAVTELASIPQISAGIDTPYPCYRFLPGAVKGEGLFMAVVRKPSGPAVSEAKAKPSKKTSDLVKLSGWFDMEMDFMTVGSDIYALPKSNASFMRNVASKLDALLLGTHTASIKGRDIIPTQQLALSVALNADAFTVCEVDYLTAIKYLQRENICLPPDTPKGIVLVTYRHTPLGFVKNLGNRSNNMLPKPWRILSQNVPPQPPEILP